MKKTLLFIALFFANLNFAQNVNIPDANFKRYLVSNSEINTNHDVEIQVAEAAAFTGTINCSNKNISDLTGIEAFLQIELLYCNDNQLANLDVSQNTALTLLNCGNNKLTSLDVSKNTGLTVLYSDNNQLTSLDVSQNTLLSTFNCSFNELSSLDVSQNSKLYNLNCRYNQLNNLDVSQNIELRYLECSRNKLANIDVSQNVALVSFKCTVSQLTNLDVSQNTLLQILECSGNQLTSLDVSQNSILNRIICSNNKLTSLNVANGNNQNIPNGNFYAAYNANLTCIQVDDVAYSTANWTNKEATASYSTNCALSTDNFELSKQFTVYPNPVNSILNIQNNEGVTFKSFSVIDLNGRVLVNQSEEIQNNSIDLSRLSSGVYFLRLETDKGLAIKRFIKE